MVSMWYTVIKIVVVSIMIIFAIISAELIHGITITAADVYITTILVCVPATILLTISRFYDDLPVYQRWRRE